MKKSCKGKNMVTRKFVVTFLRKITEIAQIVEQLGNYAIAGQDPKVTFQFPPELTKAVTLLLYKWIALSGFYLLCKDFRDAKEEDEPQVMRDERTRRENIRKYFTLINIVNFY